MKEAKARAISALITQIAMGAGARDRFAQVRRVVTILPVVQSSASNNQRAVSSIGIRNVPIAQWKKAATVQKCQTTTNALAQK